MEFSSALFKPTSTPLAEIVVHTTIRGIAAICVVLYHVSLAFRSAVPSLGQGFVAHSYLFVDLFFALSGYILARKYQDSFGLGVTTEALRQFVALRFARLYPNYLFWFLCALAVSLMVGFWKEHSLILPSGAGLSILMHVTATQGILDAPLHWNIPLWSIGVEFVLYALFPWIARFLAASGKAGAVLLAIAAVSTLVALASQGTIDIITGGLSVLRGAASFSIGMILALHFSRPIAVSNLGLSALQISACLIILLCVQQGTEVGAVLAFYFLVYVGQFNRGVLYRIARLRIFHRIGELSYSVYLSHAIMLELVILVWYKLDTILHSGPIIGFVAVSCGTVVVSVMVAEASYRYVELPGQNLLKPRPLSRRP